jgi:hypothetical protein
MIARDFRLALDLDDDRQARWLAEKTAARDRRARELWHAVLKTAVGREFISDVLLTALRYQQRLGDGTREELYCEVALHNLASAWMRDYIKEHREYYTQMEQEVRGREAQDRRELEAARRLWTRADDTGSTNDDDE